MNITNELRSWAEGDALRRDMFLRTARDQALAIADRIDAEYEKVLISKVTRAISVGEDDTEFVSMPAKELSERYMELPKDADGEYIHIGDMMAYEDNTKPMEVVALVPPAVFLTEEGPRYADMCCHYKPPTVEDVLREFAEKMNENRGMYMSEAIDADEWRSTEKATIAEYVKRLMLRTEEDK